MSSRGKKKMQQRNVMDQNVQRAAADIAPTACECGCHIFKQGVSIKCVSKERLSLFGVNMQRDLILPQTEFYCVKCFKPFQIPKQDIKLM